MKLGTLVNSLSECLNTHLWSSSSFRQPWTS